MTQGADGIEALVGNPITLWEALKQRVQDEVLKRFEDVQDDWLRFMWALDAFRSNNVLPLGAPEKSIGAHYRKKGDRFAELAMLLLQNRTDQPVGARVGVEGFSQNHQIDVAWPARKHDPLVCAETKVTGAPATDKKPIRSARLDWSNRRKELKFAATDLKLFRRQQETSIEHWGVWRTSAPPKTYFLWAARLKSGQRRGNDSIEALCRETQAVVDTYLDGAGLFAWGVDDSQQRYEPVPLPQWARSLRLDDVLYRMESEIKILAGPTGRAPEPVVPEDQTVDPDSLAPDIRSSGQS